MAFDGVDLDFEDGLFDASDDEMDVQPAKANTAPPATAAVDTPLRPSSSILDDLIVGGFEAPSPDTAVTDHDEPDVAGPALPCDAAASTPSLTESLAVERAPSPSEKSELPDGSDVAAEPYRSPALATTVSVPRQALDSVELMFDDDVDDSDAVGDVETSGVAAAVGAAGSAADTLAEAAGRIPEAEEAEVIAESEDADVIAESKEAGELGAADSSPLSPEPEESAWAAAAAEATTATPAAGAAEGSPGSGSSPDDPRARRRLDGEESATSERSKSVAARRAATRKGSSDGGGEAGALRRRGSPRRGTSPRMASRPVVRARPAPSPPPAPPAAPAPVPAAAAAASDGSVASAVFVSARVRPQTALEVSKGGYPCVSAHAAGSGGSGGGSASGISVGATSAGRRDTLYAVHRAFGAAASQADVYAAAARPVVRGVLRGFNGAILAYGQTGRCVGGWGGRSGAFAQTLSVRPRSCAMQRQDVHDVWTALWDAVADRGELD